MSIVVAISCRQPAAFARAHGWALNKGLISLFVPASELSMLPALSEELGIASLILEGDPAHLDNALPLIRVESLESQPIPKVADWPAVTAMLFTSGSTGQAAIIRKHAAAIRAELECVCATLKAELSGTEFISTVPLMHMYGYLFSFWLPWFSGARMGRRQVVYPQDLRSACREAARPVWIVTTPLHLRAYCEAGGSYPNVAGILCATAPLTPDLAARVEAVFGVQVTEIYGSTETGAVALRRWSRDETPPLWRPLDGIRIRADESGQALCSADHFEQAIVMPDQIEMHASGFLICGRSADVVKVAGKRHSISRLNALLTSLPDVLDGAFLDGGAIDSQALAPNRLLAFAVVRKGCSRQQILQSLRACIDEVFLPRPLYLVDRLPRLDTGKLRHADLVALLARCRAQEPDRPPSEPIR